MHPHKGRIIKFAILSVWFLLWKWLFFSSRKNARLFCLSVVKWFHLYGCLRLSVHVGLGNVNPTLSRHKLVSNHGLKNKSMPMESWRAGKLVKTIPCSWLPALDDWLLRMSTIKVPCTVNNRAIYLWHIFVLGVTANNPEAWIYSRSVFPVRSHPCVNHFDVSWGLAWLCYCSPMVNSIYSISIRI